MATLGLEHSGIPLLWRGLEEVHSGTQGSKKVKLLNKENGLLNYF